MPKAEETILKLVKFSLFVPLLAPLLMAASLLYPFVTTKVFFFRIAIEIIFAVYLYLAWRCPALRPKWSWLLGALLFHSLILLASGVLGVDWNLSFWGDLERMEGIFTWLHLVAYFLLLVIFLREREDWEKLIKFSLTVSALVTLYGLAQKWNLGDIYNAGAGRIDSTLGNPSFLAAYLLFHIFLGWHLFLSAKQFYWRLAYGVLMVLQVLAVLYTGTRGAFLGLGAGLVVFVISYLVFSPSRRRTILLGLATGVFLIAYIFALLNSPAVEQRLPVLARAVNLSLGDQTVNTRFIAWQAAWQGFKESPFLGSGPENFAIIFDKYFFPSFYTFTPTQTYFDRAHNLVLDKLATTGVLGIGSYLLIWLVWIFYWWRAWRNNRISLLSFNGFLALLTAYFVQNLFVFDNINSAILFVLTLGFSQFVRLCPKTPALAGAEGQGRTPPNGGVEKGSFSGCRHQGPAWGAAGLLLVFFGLLIYHFNIQPMLASRLVKRAEYFIQKEYNLFEGFKYYQRALSYVTPLDRDIRTQLTVSVGLNIARLVDYLTAEQINEMFDYAIVEMKKNLLYNPEDNFFNLKLGELYNLRSDYNKKEPTEAEYYLGRAISSSPGRLTGYYVLSQSKLLRKDYDEAVSLAREAVEMNPLFRDSYWHLAKAYYIAGRDEEAIRAMKVGLLLGYQVTDLKTVEELISRYHEKGEYKMIITLLRQAIAIKPDEARLYGRLAMAYAAVDDREKAKFYIEETLRLNPEYAAEVGLFLAKLSAGELCRVCQ